MREFDFTGEGSERNIFDLTHNIQKHEQEFQAGGSLKHQLGSINATGERSLTQPRANARGNFVHGHGVIEGALTAIGQSNNGHGTTHSNETRKAGASRATADGGPQPRVKKGAPDLC